MSEQAHRCMSNAERGATSLAMTAVVLIVAVLAVAVSSLAVVYAGAARATNAADAAALAAAVATYPDVGYPAPNVVAGDAATRNGSELVSCRCAVDRRLASRVAEVVVAVHVDVPLFGEVEVRRRSRAEFDPRSWVGR